MSWIQGAISILLISMGIFLMLTGSIGILRLPDFYSRSHATSKVDTLGILLLLGGLAVYEGMTQVAAKLVLGMLFVALANPVAVHALARAAIRFGLKPWVVKPTERGDSR